MKNEIDFSEKSILVTGAASGIGAACAQWLAARGAAELVLVDIDKEGLDALEMPCETRRYTGNVADPELWRSIEGDLSALDHAVLNAGIIGGGAITDMDFDDWRRVMSVNLDGMMLSLQCAMRLMKRRGSGSAVLTSSASALKAEPGTAAYGCSKAAVIHLAKIAAREGAKFGVRVNAIAPGGVDTPIWDTLPHFQDIMSQ